MNSKVTVIRDGARQVVEISQEGPSILDAAMDAGIDVPYSCKAAVCCTCKAKVLEGTVAMEENYSLSDQEVAEGFILSCQAHPTSPTVIVDFDVI